MKQTAVEYLVDQLFPKALSIEQYHHIEYAKKMEKQQMIEMHDKGFDAGLDFSLKEMERQVMIDLVRYIFREVDMSVPQIPYEVVDYFLEYKEKKNKL